MLGHEEISQPPSGIQSSGGRPVARVMTSLLHLVLDLVWNDFASPVSMFSDPLRNFVFSCVEAMAHSVGFCRCWT